MSSSSNVRHGAWRSSRLLFLTRKSSRAGSKPGPPSPVEGWIWDIARQQLFLVATNRSTTSEPSHLARASRLDPNCPLTTAGESTLSLVFLLSSGIAQVSTEMILSHDYCHPLSTNNEMSGSSLRQLQSATLSHHRPVALAGHADNCSIQC